MKQAGTKNQPPQKTGVTRSDTKLHQQNCTDLLLHKGCAFARFMKRVVVKVVVRVAKAGLVVVGVAAVLHRCHCLLEAARPTAAAAEQVLLLMPGTRLCWLRWVRGRLCGTQWGPDQN